MNKDLNYLYYIVYMTVNKKSGKFYIGKHATNDINDDYIGSGTLLLRAIAKHGREFFERTILYVFTTYEEADLVESELVTDDLICDPRCYNLARGGQGGNLGTEVNQRKGAAVSLALKGKRKSQAHKDAIGMSNSGKIRTLETRLRMAVGSQKKHDSRTEEERKSLFGKSSLNNNFYGKKHKQESIDLIKSKLAGTRTGGKSNRAKPITIDGIEYSCHKEAREVLGLTKNQLRRLLNPIEPKKEANDRKHYRSVEVDIDGVRYRSLAEASETLGISTYKIKRKLGMN